MFDSTGLPRVLVVDDEVIIADTLVLILNKSGYEASAAYSGEQALELAPVLEPALLITDVGMSGIDGIETAIRFRSLFPACKVVLFSGQAHAADLLHDSRKKGFSFEVLRKPVEPAVLLRHIRSVLDSSDEKASPDLQPDRPVIISVAGGSPERPAPASR
jgi:CheY-like chemotaxis protein